MTASGDLFEHLSHDGQLVHALIRAASTNNAACVQDLIQRGANPKGFDLDKETPLMWAARYGSMAALKKLLSVSDPFQRNIGRETALSLAAEAGQAQAIALLVPFGGARLAGRHGRTPLMWAALSDKAECVELLLEASDPDARDRYGASALTSAVSQGCFAAAAALVRACDAELKNGWGASALELASNPGKMNNLVNYPDSANRSRFFAELEANELLKAVSSHSAAAAAEPSIRSRRL